VSSAGEGSSGTDYLSVDVGAWSLAPVQASGSPKTCVLCGFS